MHIDDATSIDDHLGKEVIRYFFLANAIPLPGEVDESLAFIAGAPPAKIHPFWNSQLTKVADYANYTMGIQKIWGNAAPPEIRSDTRRMQSISISALLDNYGPGGSNWMAQFAYGFPVVGDISQDGVYPRDTFLNPDPPSRGSGVTPKVALDNALELPAFFTLTPLGGGPINRSLGWMAPPIPTDLGGSVATFAKGSVNISFRLGVDQAAKRRACDAIKHNEVNLYCAIWTPVKLPTWGHIAQMCLNIRPTKKNWEPPMPTTRRPTNNYRCVQNMPIWKSSLSAALLPPCGWPSFRMPSFSALLQRYCAITSPHVS